MWNESSNKIKYYYHILILVKQIWMGAQDVNHLQR